MDFFKPHWKHSNPAVRADAIRFLEEDQQPVLLSLALEDDDAGNRLAAAKRIKDTELLKKLREHATDKQIKELAQRQLMDGLSAAAKAPAATSEALGRARAALADIGDDQKTLEDIAINAASLEIRKLAFPKLVHAGAAYSVAMNEQDAQLSLKALEKVSKEAHLESLAKNAKTKTVRTAAKDKLKTLAVSKGPDTATVNRAKLNLILSVAEKISLASEEPSAAYGWQSANVQLDEAESALSELIAAGVAPDADKLARFRDSASKFRGRFARWNHERSQREQKEKQALENKRVKEDLCAQLEALGNVDAEMTEIRALRERFQSVGPAPEAVDNDLQKRFRGTLEKLEKKARDKEALARRQAEEIEHGGRLTALCEQAEALADVPVGQAADRFRELRKEWNKAFAAAGAFESKEPLRVRFEAAIASTHASLEQIRARHLERMRELVPVMEALLEHPDMASAEKKFKELHGEWKSLVPAPIGPEAEELQRRYQAFLERFREAQDWLRWSNLRGKQAICDKLEALVPQEDRKAMVAQFRELTAEWKALGPVPWDSSEALWDRYHKSCDALYEKCREYFAELEEEREGNLKAKEEMCARIEALVAAEDIDWREAMEIVKEAQSSWKAIGAVPKAQSEAVWTRFRAACNAFFERKDGYHGVNLTKKMELVALVESLQDSTDWKTTGAQIKEAQEKWKAIGPVSRDQAEAVWGRFHGACEKFYQARRAHLEQQEQEKPQNLAKKEALCVAMEGLDALPTDVERFEKIKEAQAAWKEVGPVPREMEDVLWERFRKPIDAYFEGRKARVGEERKMREENAKIKEDICLEAESLIGSSEWKSTIEKIKALQERWKATGPAPRESDRDLWKRFRTACDSFFDRLKENSAKRDSEREGNLKRKIDLCFLVEMMTARPLGEDEAKARAAWQAESLPMDIARFRVKEGAAPDWNENTEKVKNIQKEWKKIGPVPKEKSDALWERFHAACDAFFEERRVALGLRPEDPQANLELKLDLIAEVESLAQNPGGDSLSRVRNLQREWKRIGSVPRAQSDYVWKRFNDACDQVFGNRATSSREAAPEGAGAESAEAESTPRA